MGNDSPPHSRPNLQIKMPKCKSRPVMGLLNTLQEGRTSITIAHRLSTVRGADKIFVVRQGAVVESGAHAELLARAGGVYARMCEEQTL